MSHYSLQWAKTILETFTGHYARATEYLLDFCGKTDEYLVECLRFHQNAWELIKIIIKSIDREVKFLPDELIVGDTQQLVEKIILDHKDRALNVYEHVHGDEKRVLTILLGSVMLSLDGFQGDALQSQLW